MQRRSADHHPQLGQRWHRDHEVAVAAQHPLAERDHDGGAGQPCREGERADHDGLRRQDPDAPRARGQGDADQAAPVLGGDEHRPHNDHHDQPGERAREGLGDGGAHALRAHGRRDVAGAAHRERAADLVEPAELPGRQRANGGSDIGTGPPVAGPRGREACAPEADVVEGASGLRTPLTAERSLLQVALADPDATAETLRSTCEEVLALGRQQERLIEALLTLASSERGVEQWEPFDLADIAGKAVAARHQEAERRRIHVDATLAAAPATGDPRLAESLVANLLDNALRHNVAGGRVEISTARAAGRAVISVSNTGTLIPPDKLSRLFQPFQQLGSERIRHTDGHGLGLAIVHAIASAHSAALSARARPDGGLDIEVGFP